MTRSRFLLATLVAALGLSGGSPPAATPAEAPEAPALERVESRLGQLNPLLTPAERSRIVAAVERYAVRYELPLDLVLAVIEVESSARIDARSPKGALGLMQVMPHMAAALDLAGNHTTIETNIEAGCLILAHNIRRLGEEDGISAYFWGSDIRGVGYLNRVRAARASYRHLLAS